MRYSLISRYPLTSVESTAVRHTEFGNADTYLRAFSVLEKEGIPPKHLELLRAHVESANQTATWPELAQAVGYANSHAVNLQYGKLARRVAEQLGFSQPPRGFWLFVLVDWAKEHPDDATAYVLRRPVIEALARIGIITKPAT